MRPFVERLRFPRPGPPQDGWLQTGATPAAFDATTIVAVIAQQQGWRTEVRDGWPALRPQDTAAIATTLAEFAIRYAPAIAQQRAWDIARRRGMVQLWPQEAWWAATFAFDATTVIAALAQQRDWTLRGLVRGPLPVVSTGWWIAETFGPSIFWSAVASQQRAWLTPRRPLFPSLQSQVGWWSPILPVEFDVATIVGPLAQQRDWQIVGKRDQPLRVVSADWIGAQIAPAVAGASFIPILRRRRR